MDDLEIKKQEALAFLLENDDDFKGQYEELLARNQAFNSEQKLADEVSLQTKIQFSSIKIIYRGVEVYSVNGVVNFEQFLEFMILPVKNAIEQAQPNYNHSIEFQFQFCLEGIPRADFGRTVTILAEDAFLDDALLKNELRGIWSAATKFNRDFRCVVSVPVKYSESNH